MSTDESHTLPRPVADTADDAAPRARAMVVAAAIVDDLVAPSMLLTARRTEPPTLAGGWEFAGGKVDPGETPLQALHREVREELGVTVELGELVPGPLPGYAWPLGDRWEMFVWLAVVIEGEPAPIEDHDAIRWLAADELYTVPWLPADLPIVETIEPLLTPPAA